MSERDPLIKSGNWQDTLKAPRNSPIYNIASDCTSHAACPIPVAILKAIEVEVEVGATLPKDVVIRFETNE